MAQKLREGSEGIAKSRIVYESTGLKANHGDGEAIARRAGGRLILLHELIADGYLLGRHRGEWVLLGDNGTRMEGLKIVNADGATPRSMFTPASRAREERLETLKAYFHPAPSNLSAYIGDNMLVVRQFGVPGSDYLGTATPAVVIARPPVVEPRPQVDREIIDNLGASLRDIEEGKIKQGLEALKAVKRALEGE